MRRDEGRRAWAVIPARGGSKGISGKNLSKIQGRSLIARAVEAARLARSVGRVLVSTDDAAIAAVARESGAEIIERPEAISDDTASSESALLHALDTVRDRGDALPDVLVFLQCTAPFLIAADIDGTVDALVAASADSAFAAARQHGFLWRSGDDGAHGVNHAGDVRQRRQDRPAEFLEAGSVYVMRVAGFQKARHRFFGKIVLYEIPPLRVLEIDTADDLARARALAPLIDTLRS